MTQVYRTLRFAPSDEGVLGVVIDAPPMNLIGPELVRDLVGLLGALESDQETRVVVLKSADPDYFVPQVDLTKLAEYTAEAAKAGGPDDASLGMLCTSSASWMSSRSRRSAAGRGGQRTGAGVRHAVRRAGECHPGTDRGRRRRDPGRGRRAAPGPAAGTGPGHGGDSRRGRLRRRTGRTVRLDQPGPARRRPGRVRGPLARRIASFPADSVRSAKRVLNELTMPGADAIRADARRFRQLVASDPAQARAAALFTQGLQTRGPLELDLGDLIGAL